jgi:hypothetical protein
MARVHGRHGQISIGASSPTAVIGSLNAWNISFTRDKVDVTSFGDSNKTYLSGLKDVSGGFEGFFDTLYIRQLMDASDSVTGTIVRITPSTDYPDFYYEGPATMDLTNTGAVNDAIKITATFSATGAWTLQVDGSPV